MTGKIPPISILMRTLNEADRLANSLESVIGLGDEIVVIDSGSTDGTVDIAERFGARVIYNPWQGFGPQRSFGEQQCKHHWVFFLDADEVVTPALREEIMALFEKGEPDHACYYIRNTMVLPGDSKPRFLADFRKVPRLYNLRHARVKPDPSYDRVTIDEGHSSGILKARQHHHSFRNWGHTIAKLNFTSDLAARTQDPKPIWLLYIRLVFELPLEMLKYLFVRRFIFGGWKGFAFATTQAFARFARILKMIEQQKTKR